MCGLYKWWLLLCCGMTLSLNAQPWAAKALHADLDTLVARILRQQPSIYRYQAKAVLQHRLRATKAQLQGQVTANEWLKALHYLLAAVGEGHLQIGTAQDEWYTGFVEGRFRSFPLTVRYLEGRLYAWHNYSPDEQWQRGDELIAINGWSIDSLRRHFHDHSLADGKVVSSRDKDWQEEFSARYYWLVSQPDSFVVACRPYGQSAVERRVLPALTMLEMAQWAQKRQQIPQRPKGLDALYRLRLEGEQAILQLRSFDLEQWRAYDQTPAAFYEATFRRLRRNGIRCLILDLRGNKGGERSFVDDCLPYLKLRPSTLPYQIYHNQYAQQEFYYLPNRHPLHFRGKLLILIDGGTYSSAALLAQYAATYADAHLIGGEAGSRVEGFAGGVKTIVKLPHSGTSIYLPLTWVEHQTLPPSAAPEGVQRGLLPHQVVELRLEDLLNGRDAGLEAALEHCR